MITVNFDIPKPKYDVIKTELRDYPIIVQRDDGYYHATYNGEAWRICTNDYCFNAWWPSSEAAHTYLNEMETITWKIL